MGDGRGRRALEIRGAWLRHPLIYRGLVTTLRADLSNKTRMTRDPCLLCAT
jgi:hypothetical protein